MSKCVCKSVEFNSLSVHLSAHMCGTASHDPLQRLIALITTTAEAEN